MATKKPTFYYDENGSVMIIEGEKEILLSLSKAIRPEDRDGFLDHFRTVGADHPYPSRAKGVVTIGANMTLRDLEQAVWRLRNLHLNQSVVFAISSRVRAVILKTLQLKKDHQITYEDILAFTFVNQCRQIGTHTSKALPMQLEEVVQNILVKVLTDSRVTPEGKRWAFKTLRSAWFKPAIYRAASMYGKLPGERQSTTVIQEQVEATKSTLDLVFAQIPFIENLGFNKEAIFKEIDAIAASMQSRLPRVITGNDVDVDQAMELSVHISLHAEIQKQMTNEHEDQIGKVELGSVKIWEFMRHSHVIQTNYTPLTQSIMKDVSRGIPVIKLSDVISLDSILNRYEGVFSPRFALDINVLEWIKDINDVNSVKLLGSYRTPLHWVTFDKANNYMVLHCLDTVNNIQQKYHSNIGYTHVGGDEGAVKEFAFELMQLQFLKGNPNFKRAVLPMLKNWIRQAGPERMQDLFLHIIRRSPRQTKTYQQNNPGNIRFVFDELLRK